MDICSNEDQRKIIQKFKEIKYNDGLILIDYIINNEYEYDIKFIKDIIISLSENKNKYTYEIYEYINKKTNIDYYTPLYYYDYYDTLDDDGCYENYLFMHFCALNNNIIMLKYLINKGINIDLQNNDNTSSLLFSTRHNFLTNKFSFETIKFLLENGANPNLQNNYNETALTNLCAPYLRNTKLIIEPVDLLLKYGANPNLEDALQRTPLMYISNDLKCSYSRVICKLLLENGADPHLKNILSETAYIIAKHKGYEDLLNSYMN